MEFSIIIPSYNGSQSLLKNLPEFILFLAEMKLSHEIIVVDDGSSDFKVIENFCLQNQLIFLRNEQNLGKGAAVKKGVLNSKGKYIIFTDVDIPFEYSCFELFLENLRNSNIDLVVGDRLLDASIYFMEISKKRKRASEIFAWCVDKFILGGRFDTQCGMKGFKKDVAVSLFQKSRINGFAFDVEILSMAVRKNYSIKRLPVKLRNQENSSIHLLKHSFEMIWDLIRIKIFQLSGKYK
ncbi:MAG: glycosyltransferase [Flavobacteriia bacterium]|jgi:dolichyl-phosphate beta-glucosyltransferase